MTKLLLSVINKFKLHIPKILLAVVGLVMIATVWAIYESQLAIKNLAAFKLSTAAAQARRAQPLTQLWVNLTGHRQPDIISWQTGLTTIITLDRLSQQLATNLTTQLTHSDPSSAADQPLPNYQPLATNQQPMAEQPANPNSTRQLTTLLDQLTALKTALDRSWLVKNLIDDHYLTALTIVDQLQPAWAQFTTGQKRYLIIFQNSEELRATGGFMGSYAIATFNQGQLQNIQLEDIYVPDGQFSGLVPAPPGVAEFLSSGRGLRLPDANWYPDFPTSAQQILNYFAFGNEADLDGVIAVNLEVVEDMLTVFGPIDIPDYQLTVTAQNLSTVARADRDQFFPGSQQKKHFLSLLFNQFTIALGQLDHSQLEQLAEIFLTHAQHKDLQFFSQDQSWQAVFTQLHLSGQMKPPLNDQPGQSCYFFPVESNVGINKANRQLSRSFRLQLDSHHSTLTHTLTNLNYAPNTPSSPDTNHLGYINYQRYYLLPTFQPTLIAVDGQPVDDWQQNLITINNQQLLEIGFLVTVPHRSTVTITLELDHPPLIDHPRLVWQKQAGTNQVPVVIEQASGTLTSLELTTDIDQLL